LKDAKNIDVLKIDKRFAELFVGAFGFDNTEFEYLLSHFTRKELKKGDFFCRVGDTGDSKAYINKGCTRTFVFNEDGRESILFFSFEDWWLCDFASFNSGNPGNYNIEALEDCELLYITKHNWEKLQTEIPKFRLWYTIKVPRSDGAMLNRFADQRLLSAEERYLAILKNKPHILQRVPLQHVASYLNIEPQSLSRIRKRVTKNK
jgi:CRP-like cAMP-binding protein